MEKPMTDSYPKRYWWIPVAAVPIAVAVVAVLPDLIGGDGRTDSPEESGNRISIEGSTVGGDVQIIGTQVILQQAGVDAAGVDAEALTEKLERAQNLVQARLYQDAIPLFEELSAELGSPALYANLGGLYLVQGNYAKARAALSEGVAIDPDYQPLRLNLGRLYQQQGDIGEAIRQLEKAQDEPQAKVLLRELQQKVSGGLVENEPNDDILSPNAMPVDQPVDGVIAADSDADFYRFKAPGLPRDRYRISLSNGSTDLKPRLTLRGADKQQLWANASYGHQVTASQDVDQTFSLDPDSDYFVSVSSLSGTGPYQIAVRPLKAYDAYEPNDDILNAKPIAAGESIEADILDGKDIDFYRFTSPTDTLHIALSNGDPSYKPQVQLWAEDKSRLWRNRDYGHQLTAGQDVEVERESEAGAVYYVSVGSLGGTGRYSLTVAGR
jgi:tetratricopeptide (TPR) repeat protein